MATFSNSRCVVCGSSACNTEHGEVEYATAWRDAYNAYMATHNAYVEQGSIQLGGTEFKARARLRARPIDYSRAPDYFDPEQLRGAQIRADISEYYDQLDGCSCAGGKHSCNYCRAIDQHYSK